VWTAAETLNDVSAISLNELVRASGGTLIDLYFRQLDSAPCECSTRAVALVASDAMVSSVLFNCGPAQSIANWSRDIEEIVQTERTL
jgi:hypothetical protein